MDLEFKKDPVTGKYRIRIDPKKGSFRMVTGIDDLRQRIETVLSMILGEWEWDAQLGIPMFDPIFRRPELKEEALLLIKKQIQKLPGVVGINRLEMTGIEENRRVIEYEARYQDGGSLQGSVKEGDYEQG